MKGNGYWRAVYLAIPLTVAVFAGIMAKNSADSVPDMTCPVAVSCTTEAVDVQRFERVPEAEPAMTCPVLETYTEGDGPAPEWWMPDEPMAAEWIADVADINVGNKSAGDTDVPSNARQSDLNPIQRTDAGCPDWNVDTTVYGWDGRTMEAWEMDVFSRVMYLEFWGTSPECCEAGADAILRLWESGYYGETMYGVLSAETEVGGPVFETWDAVWGSTYDPDGLAEMRSLCEERFRSGPVWIAPFFRTGHYHDWAVPCYELDGVYFSTGKGW